MKKKVVAAFLAVCMVCQGSMAYAAQPELFQGTEVVSPETPEEEIIEEETNGFELEDKESADASGTIKGTTVHWSISGSTLTISNTGSNTAIPDYEYGVVAPWDSYRHSVKDVVIGSGITGIGDYAFHEMSSLEKVTINSNVLTRIGEHAFDKCAKLKEINLPDTLTDMGIYAFSRCGEIEKLSAKGLVTPSSLKEIPDYAFAKSKITGITFSSAVTEIGANAFYDCDSLETVTFEGTSVKTIGDAAFKSAGTLKSIVLPDGLKYIGAYAFSECGALKSVGMRFQESIEEIESDAFSGCANDIMFYVMRESGYILQYLKENFPGKYKTYQYMGNEKTDTYKIQVSGDTTYTGKPVTPKVTVTNVMEGVLQENVDYTVSYSNNVSVGKNAKVIITGINGYYGSMEKTFTILPINIAKNAEISGLKKYAYTGKAIKPEVTVKVKGVTLVKGKDYTISYSNNVNVGNNAKIVIKGMGSYAGTIEKTFTIQADLSKAKVTIKKQIYTGKKLTPNVKVVLNGKTLVKDKDYKVSYSGNKNIGKNAKAIIKGMGQYTGEISKKFTIAPQKPKVTVNGYKIKISNYKKGADVYLTVKVAGKNAVKLQCTAKKYQKNKCVDLTNYLKKYKGKKVTITVYMKANGVKGSSTKKTI